MIDSLTLITGESIYIPALDLTFYQPKIKDIVSIGEEDFQNAIQFFLLDKENLNIEDKNVLLDKSNFDIILEMFNTSLDNEETKKIQLNCFILLQLFFPDEVFSGIDFENKQILFESNSTVKVIDNSNFDTFQECLTDYLGANHGKAKKELDFNPKSDKAKEIAEKIKKGRKKVEEIKKKEEAKKDNVFSESLFGKYISVLSVALQLDIHTFLEYTPFQLLDNYKRVMKKDAFEINLKAQMAGATELKEAEHWII